MTAENLVTVVVDGAFGTAVADAIGALRDVIRVPVGGFGVDHSAIAPRSEIILATARGDGRVEVGLAAAAVNWGTRFLPVVLAANLLRVGPLVQRGVSGCSRCLRIRTRQHAASVELIDALESDLAADPSREVAGFLPMHAGLAAGLALDELESAGPDEPSVARYVDLLSGVLRRVPVTGVHACPICGLQRDERDRTVERLAPALAAVVGAGAR